PCLRSLSPRIVSHELFTLGPPYHPFDGHLRLECHPFGGYQVGRRAVKRIAILRRRSEAAFDQRLVIAGEKHLRQSGIGARRYDLEARGNFTGKTLRATPMIEQYLFEGEQGVKNILGSRSPGLFSDDAIGWQFLQKNDASADRSVQ